jgi:hypothetical protein
MWPVRAEIKIGNAPTRRLDPAPNRVAVRGPRRARTTEQSSALMSREERPGMPDPSNQRTRRGRSAAPARRFGSVVPSLRFSP